MFTPIRTDSRRAPSRWETSLQIKPVSHWLCANLEQAQGPVSQTIFCPQFKFDRNFALLKFRCWPSDRNKFPSNLNRDEKTVSETGPCLSSRTAAYLRKRREYGPLHVTCDSGSWNKKLPLACRMGTYFHIWLRKSKQKETLGHMQSVIYDLIAI